MKKHLLFLIVTILIVSAATSQTTVELVKDINPSGDSNPYNFVEYDGKLFFRANDGANGPEIWMTDGTSTGTELLKDIYPVTIGGYPIVFTLYDNRLYFIASTVTMNKELYESDGTEAGTHVVAPNIAPLSDPCNNTFELFNYNDTLYFNAHFTTNGGELYRLGRSTASLQKQELISFQAYPNPANDKLTITSEKKAVFTLLDMTGKVLQSFDVNKQREISIADLAAGIYLLRENTTGAQRRIVKQ